jgi:hypothetical protein
LEVEIHTTARLYGALSSARIVLTGIKDRLRRRIKDTFAANWTLVPREARRSFLKSLQENQLLIGASTTSARSAHHFKMIHNALATERRTRHFDGTGVDDVHHCYFCKVGQDSMAHLYGMCPEVAEAWRINAKKRKIQLPGELSYPYALLMTKCTKAQVSFVLRFNHAVWRARAWHKADPRKTSPTVSIGTHLNRRGPKRKAKKQRDLIAQKREFLHLRSLVPKEATVIYTDGSAVGTNPGPAGAGYYIPNLSICLRRGEFAALGVSTNNRAEFMAIFLAINAADHCFPPARL